MTTDPHVAHEVLTHTLSLVAAELRALGDAPSVYAPAWLAFPSAASVVAKAAQLGAAETAVAGLALDVEAAPSGARGDVGPILQSPYSQSVMFLAAPSNIATSAGVLLDASTSPPAAQKKGS
jgi:hypothetical protein